MKPEELHQRDQTAAAPIEPGCVVYVERLFHGRYTVESVHNHTITIYAPDVEPIEIPISWALRVDNI